MHSHADRQCMHDPHHGLMRSATAGYPQTAVITAASEKGRRWRRDGRSQPVGRAAGPHHPPPLPTGAAGRLTTCPGTGGP